MLGCSPQSNFPWIRAVNPYRPQFYFCCCNFFLRSLSQENRLSGRSGIRFYLLGPFCNIKSPRKLFLWSWSALPILFRPTLISQRSSPNVPSPSSCTLTRYSIRYAFIRNSLSQFPLLSSDLRNSLILSSLLLFSFETYSWGPRWSSLASVGCALFIRPLRGGPPLCLLASSDIRASFRLDHGLTPLIAFTN